MIRVLFCLFLMTTCFKSDDSLFEISLKSSLGSKSDVLYMTRMNYELDAADEIPGLSEIIRSEYKGIPKKDSVFFYLKMESFAQYSFDLYKRKKYRKDLFLEYVKKEESTRYDYLKNQYIKDLLLWLNIKMETFL